MSMAPRLDLRQSQSLVMTPQLQQAIKLLTLSNLEIEGFIAEELEKNPLLEAGRDDGDAPDSVAADRVDAPEQATADQLIAAGEGAADQPLDVDYDAETFIHDGPTDGPRALDGGLGMDRASGGGGMPEDGQGFEATLAADPSLQDHLLAQAGQVLAGADLLVAGHLIDLVDEAGYLAGRIEDVADRLGMPVAEVERVLAVVQGLDPTGVAARGLAECLALQAREADRYDPCMAALIANLELVARGAMAQLRRLCGVDDEDLIDMIRELRGYDPKPGLRFGGGRIEAVSPDVFVARRGSGWAIELNGATLPRVLMNRSYYVELSGGAKDKASRAWLADCVTSANWLVKALDQRARTIVKVATELVTQQQGFFDHGVTRLRPLTLKMVADAIGMHESTVSRVTSNKYLSCERGVFELKYFFTSGIQSADGGEAASAVAVKDAIARLIAGEGRAILSDDALVDRLRAQGFDIARRTVAKYREAIGLGSSVQRRRQKALAG